MTRAKGQTVMEEILLSAGNRPDGPSWSPYLAIGLFIVFGIIIAFLYMRKRAK
ncbi:hypothetical protein JHN55_16255 [Streptomyces sp. MBT56]|uniref:hypothetical protein n=1 Tax=unclassified Streptomyces TaxID=2593676 RepID=UPI00190B4F25|nr:MULTISPECIES: hypothetical protein [unclassified Streptomyces]MBK3558056.1 hypothetical protein [Streptomyces sp. MBT56]MBK3601337.1 hypothetical protein [Streptomyces sp. MBT54]MBK3615043.1 hypothetical protein [Streptomyces sp. MBT98]MBK6046860.1 hypothetical protein [Streptomyces sp. MBT55]